MPTAKVEYFAANWKLDGTRASSTSWVDKFNVTEGRELLTSTNRIIVAPPIHLLALVADDVAKYGLSIAVAAQELDPQADALYLDKKGVKHTEQGFVPALIADCAQYVILGHSETRTDKNLSNDDINKRLDLARKYKLLPIVCVANIEQAIEIGHHDTQYSGMMAYEPPGNIGTIAADPAEANEVCKQIKQLYPNVLAWYGGSVDKTNIRNFLSQDAISGVLVGNRSSNVDFFQDIIKSAVE